MIQRTRRASALPATAGPRPDSAAPLPPGLPPRRTSARRARGSGRAGAPAEVLVRRSVVEPCLTCGICGNLLRDATAFSECLHAYANSQLAEQSARSSRRAPPCGICGGLLCGATAFSECIDAFCRKCIYDKLVKENIKCCPTCGIHLGRAPLEKLRSTIFPAKRRKVATIKKRKEKVSAESVLSSVVDIVAEGSTAPLASAASQVEEQKIEVEVINDGDEALVAQESDYESSILNLAPVGRDVLSRIRCRDFYSACHLSAETGALIVWQPSTIPEEMVGHDQLDLRQDSQTFGPPATSDAEYQQKAPAVQMTNITSGMAGSSLHAKMIVQDEDNLRGDILTFFNESIAKIMGRYDAHIRQLKAENSKLIEQLENERAAALERTRILEERHRQELENERAAADERTRILEERVQRQLDNEREGVLVSMRMLTERLQRESDVATSATNRNRSLEAENDRLNEELENGRADNQALMSDLVDKSDELATLKYHCDMFESDKKDLENQVENLKEELEYAKKEHARYVRQVLDAARAVPNNLEAIHIDAPHWIEADVP